MLTSGGILIRLFGFYFVTLLLFALIGFKNGAMNNHDFHGGRYIASDCNESFSAIIRHEIPEQVIDTIRSTSEETALKHYRFKNTIWNKILTARDFEGFNANEYFRLLELYKDPRQSPNLLEMNPVTVEQKLALIEAIQLRFSYFNKLPSIQDEIESLNAYKLKKLQKLLRSFDLSKRLTRENLEEFSSEFFLIIKGPPVSLLDYFTLNKTERMNQRMLRVLQEDLLVRGLRGSLERISPATKETNIEKAKTYVKQVMKYKVWRFLVMPYDLPWIDQVKISDELLEKVLLDGLDAHQSELIVELKRQNAIDHYERFRKVYRPVAFGVGFYFYYSKYQKQLSGNDDSDEGNDEAKKKFLDDFKKLSDSLSSGESKIKTENEIKEEQFQRVLKTFKQRYHEDPTPEEYQELRRKIFNN